MKKALLIASVLFIAVISTACINNIAVQELNNKAAEFMQKGDYESAMNRLEASIDLDSTMYETYYNLGIAATNAKKYEEAIEEFYSQVDRYFTEALGVKPSDRALVSSVSYSGVDKAIMDLGQKKGINTLTVTPFDYSIYGRAEHPFPTVVTDTIPQYVDVYGKLSDNIIVTGGRDHAFKFDAGGKWLKQNAGLVIPVDVLKDYKGIKVPATINGKVENAAAMAYETFANPMPANLLAGFRYLPADKLKQDLTHDAQKALATAMWNDLLKNGFKLQ